MHKKPEVTAALIEKYHLGLATPEEAKEVETWLNEDVMEFAPLPLSPQKREQKKLAIWTGITSKNNISPLQPKHTNRKLLKTIAAASALTFALIAFIYLSNIQTTKNSNLVKYHQLDSKNGHKASITLSDGTIIRVNAGSTLSYPDQFTGKERVVKLNGEAYFEVAKSKHKPFIIHTQQGRVRVLGTKFNLKAFANDSTESLSLDEGSVKYADAADASNFVVLSPQQHAILNDPDNSFNVRPAKPQDVAWMHNQLAFTDLPLNEIAKQLERWYGISITITNKSLGEQRYTGTYNNPSLNRLLEQLGYVMGFKYSIKNGKEVTINKTHTL